MGPSPTGRRARTWAFRAAALLVLGPLALVGLAVAAVETASYVIELPSELEHRAASLRLYDRHGELLREVRSGRETKSRPVPLRWISRHVVAATLAAEDRRFFEHGGVDVLALGRAIAQDVLSGEVVSGASTITMQLARILRGGERTLGNKFLEAALARKIERALDKGRILEEYLNRAPYGNDLEGIEAAAWGYFRKSSHDLSLGEAAMLAAMPRSPTLYDPYKHRDNLKARRDRVLERMRRGDVITEAEWRRAAAEPVAAEPPLRRFEAPHFVQWILSMPEDLARTATALAGDGGRRLMLVEPGRDEIVTTLDLELQRRVETLVERTVRELAPRGGKDAAVVVLDNRSGEVLAYVGSADFFDPEAGQVDGARALRQPGSALKPFTYALAFQSGFSPASILPDIPSRFATGEGDWFEPHNYDSRFHGPVRAREALANSYNVPAVFLAQVLTPAKLLQTYRIFGLTMLDRPAEFYGVAITLGDGEVTLLALANAYATLARGGLLLPPRSLRTLAASADGARRVLPAPVAWLVTDVLADRRARLAAFGEGNALELPFRVAAKTGTSKSYRDNWTMGYTDDLTVGVWVGNFSGEPMGSVSGITGAGPLFREVMLAAMEGRSVHEAAPPAGVERIRICPLSGELAGPDCPHAIDDFVLQAGPERARLPTCRYHRRLAIDARDGLLAGPGCPLETVEPRVFEAYPPRFLEWAVDAHRPVPPGEYSPLCPGPPPGTTDATATSDATVPAVAIAYPADGARFSLDTDIPRQLQTIPLQAHVASGDAAVKVRFEVDGRFVGEAAAPFRVGWPLEPGDHVVTARLPGGETAEASFAVR